MSAPAIAFDPRESPGPSRRIGAVELTGGVATARLTLVVSLSQGNAPALVETASGGVLGLLAASDIRHGVIPNRLVYPALAVALAASLFRPDVSLITAVVGMVAGGGPFLVLFVAAPGSTGGGDVKMSALVGAIVGFPAALGAIATAAIGGGIVSAAVMCCRRGPRGVAIPYGPFLAVGALLAVL